MVGASVFYALRWPLPVGWCNPEGVTASFVVVGGLVVQTSQTIRRVADEYSSQADLRQKATKMNGRKGKTRTGHPHVIALKRGRRLKVAE